MAFKLKTRIYGIFVALAGSTLLAFIYWSQQLNARPKFSLFSADSERMAEKELDKLFSEHPGSVLPSPQACSGYWELREINFLHPALYQSLCRNHTAYTVVNNKFPPCEIRENLPSQLLNRVNKTAMRGYIASVLTGRSVTIYTYPPADIVSGFILSSVHNWEPEQVTTTLSIAWKFPLGSVTFMDIGCNIGVYSLQARDAGIPTVAVDANIRNLIRIRMSANDMNWLSDPKLKLMWMYFHNSVSLQYLNFGTSMCNVGGATSSKDVMTDTIPVMTGKADDLLSSVDTDLVVMKIDIETSEHIFFSTGERLFSEKKIIAVQMEFWRSNLTLTSHTSPNFDRIVEFFVERNYSLFSAQRPLKQLNISTLTVWDGIWIRDDFQSVAMDKTKEI